MTATVAIERARCCDCKAIAFSARPSARRAYWSRLPMSKTAGRVTVDLLALPARLATHAGLSREACDLADREIRAALTELANGAPAKKGNGE